MTKSKSLVSRPKFFERLLGGLQAMALTLSSVAVVSCVTVNVNFPESAVQKATDDYVRDLYRARERGKTGVSTPEPSTPAPITPKGASALPQGTSLMASAWAAEDEGFRVSTVKSQAIKENLRSRIDEVLLQKRTGVLGETRDGKLVIRDPSKLKTLLAGKVQRLVSDENSDRKNLYDEVLSANALPAARLKNVELSFARSFQAESPPGTWIQDAEGSWKQK